MNKYNLIAKEYDLLFNDVKTKKEKEAIRTYLLPVIKNKSIIDIGCGTGCFLDLFPETKPEKYIGVDPSVRMINRLLVKHPNMEDSVICAKFEQLLLKKQDIRIALFGSINYIDPPKVLFLSPGNYFFMFYKEDYTPKLYNSVKMKHFNYPETKLRQFFNNVIDFGNYFICTNLF